MDEDVEKILSKVKDTMDKEDIRKLSILPINSPDYYWDELLGIDVEGCDCSAGGVQLEQLKDIIRDIIEDVSYHCDYYIMCWYIIEVLDNLWRIQYD